jgi:hypothetical protein
MGNATLPQRGILLCPSMGEDHAFLKEYSYPLQGNTTVPLQWNEGNTTIPVKVIPLLIPLRDNSYHLPRGYCYCLCEECYYSFEWNSGLPCQGNTTMPINGRRPCLFKRVFIPPPREYYCSLAVE